MGLPEGKALIRLSSSLGITSCGFTVWSLLAAIRPHPSRLPPEPLLNLAAGAAGVGCDTCRLCTVLGTADHGVGCETSMSPCICARCLVSAMHLPKTLTAPPLIMPQASSMPLLS